MACFLSHWFPFSRPNPAFSDIGWLLFLPQPSALSNEVRAPHPPLCARLFSSFLTVLMKKESHSHMASIFLYPLLLTRMPSVSRCVPLSPKRVTCCPELLSSSTHPLRSLLHVPRTDRTRTGHPGTSGCFPSATLGARSEQDRWRHGCSKRMF